MADRKENELTKANNFAYVRALDSNGNSIQISKSDLVSVLEELIGTATNSKSGLMSKQSNLILRQSFLSNKVFKLVDGNEIGMWQPCMFIFMSCNTNGLINYLYLCYVALSNTSFVTNIYQLLSVGNVYTHFYKANNKLYFQSSETNRIYIFGLQHSITEVPSLEISGAEEVEISNI